MKANPEIFREYDIRGVVGQDFDRDFAYSLGHGFAQFIREKSPKQKKFKVSVGHDARLSSGELTRALCDGLLRAGFDVEFLGLITTPMSYFSTFVEPLDGAVMVTGSHNPPEYNGFKLTMGQSCIYGDDIQHVKKLMERAASSPSSSHGDAKISGQITEKNLLPTYIARYAGEFKISNSKPPVIFDCGNGVAGVVLRPLLDALKLQCEIMFEEPDGRFPNHHPDPTVEKYLAQLQERVRQAGAVAGIGFDGDADRIGVVDHTGRMVFGDELLCVYARAILQKNPGITVIGDVKCSDRLYSDVRVRGGKPLMYKTGHSLIKAKMKELGAPLAGEMSGHICFGDRNYGYDDAPYAAFRLLEILTSTGQTISELLAGLPKAYATPEIRIDTTEEKKRAVVAVIKKLFSNGSYQINDIDGVRVSFSDGFGLVRSSNTQPVVVCRFEAATEARLREIRQSIEEPVLKFLKG